MSNSVQFNINVGAQNSNATINELMSGLSAITGNLNTLNRNFIGFSQQSIGALQNLQAPVMQVNKNFSDATNKVLLFTQAAQGISNLKNAITANIEPGVKLNSSMADLSAITGVTGTALKGIEMNARASAKAFGIDAAGSAESYKLILSQLSPDIAKNSEALKAMGNNISITSKLMGGDTTAAANVLTTAMNQYGVSLDDPMKASREMSYMMNIMAAGAKEGSAELPQISAALQQSGLMAKTAGVGFAELNGAIQVLDKAGKKGAEGGVAIRNMLAEMSQGTMNSPKTLEMLKEAHIDISKLSDSSLTFSQRLQLLKPIAGDTAAMTQLFGKENVAAAMALVNQTGELDRYTAAIQNTNSATEQANTVMSGWRETQNRAKAVIDDWKISIFNGTKAVLGYVETGAAFVEQTAQVASGIQGVTGFLGKLLPARVTDTAATTTEGVAQGFLSKMINSVSGAFGRAIVAVRGFGIAIMNIPVIGWIIAAVTALVAIFYELWEHSKRFREIMYGIWEAAKAVFNNIGIVISRLWENIIKPVIGFVANYFIGLWEIVVTVFTGIYDAVSAVFSWISETATTVGAAIGDFFVSIWKSITNLFSGISGFVDKWLVEPIRNAFNYLWDIISGVFAKIMDGLKKIFAPIIELWNKIFSGEGMQDVSVAFKDGEKKGAESFDKDKAASNQSADPAGAKKAVDDKERFKELMGGLGGSAVSHAAGKKGGKDVGMGMGSGGGKATTINVVINKLQDQIVIHTTNLQTSAKEAANKVVEELLLALNSVNAKGLANGN